MFTRGSNGDQQLGGRDVVFGVILVGLLVLSVLTLRAFTGYILAAALLAFLLNPVHRRLSVVVGARPSAFLLVVASTFVAMIPLGLVGWALLSDARDVSEDLTGRPVLFAIARALETVGLDVDVLGGVRGMRRQLLNTLVGELSGMFGVAVKFSIGISLLAFLLYYFLIDGGRFVAWVKSLGLLREAVQEHLYENAQNITWAVLKGHILVSIAQGIVGGVGLYFAGVPNAPFWTIVMVLLAFVPVIGVAAVWVPAVAYLVYVDQLSAALFLFLYSATVVSWIDNVLRALVVNHGADLHPGLVLAGVLGGVYFWGVLGIFIGPIVLGLFKAALLVYTDFYLAPEEVAETTQTELGRPQSLTDGSLLEPVDPID